jgi:predicted Zn-dependent protease
MSEKEEKVRERLSKEPGNPIFAEFAEYLRRKKDYAEALNVCFSGLSSNPSCHVGRLVLARIFYNLDYAPFAARELETLLRVTSEDESLRRLVLALNPMFVESEAGSTAKGNDTAKANSTVKANDTIIAETVFDMGSIDLLED